MQRNGWTWRDKLESHPVDVHNPPKVIEANTDADAIAPAMQLVNGHDCEAWDQARRVGFIRRHSP